MLRKAPADLNLPSSEQIADLLYRHISYIQMIGLPFYSVGISPTYTD